MLKKNEILLTLFVVIHFEDLQLYGVKNLKNKSLVRMAFWPVLHRKLVLAHRISDTQVNKNNKCFFRKLHKNVV